MFKTKLFLLFIALSVFYVITPSGAPQPAVASRGHSYDLPELMNRLPADLSRGIFADVAKPIIKMRYSPQTGVERSLREALSPQDYAEFRNSVGNGNVMNAEQRLNFKVFLSAVRWQKGLNTQQTEDFANLLVKKEEEINPVGPMTLNRIQVATSAQEAHQLQLKKRAESSIVDRVKARVGCRRIE